jgi:hypothetical protein
MILTGALICAFIRHGSMEQENTQNFQVVQTPGGNQDVGFPQPPVKKRSSLVKVVILVVGVLLIVGAGGLFIYKNYSGSGAKPSPSPTSAGLRVVSTPEPEATQAPTATPEASVDKSQLKVEVLNGTGIAGDAGLVKRELEKLGYKSVEAKNADSQNETRTTVTYGGSVSQDDVDEIVKMLEKIYEQVRTRKGSLDGADIRVVTGPKKSSGTSATASASASPTASPSASPQATE